MWWALLLMWSCGPTPDGDGAAPAVLLPTTAASQHAARAAPTGAAPWKGDWKPRVLAVDPKAPGPVALAAALRQSVGAWDQTRPQPAPGEVALVWIAADAPLEQVMPRLVANDPSAQSGAVVAVLGPGSAPWRKDMAAQLPWAQVGVIDPIASLGTWTHASTETAPDLMGKIAGLVAGRHYRLPRAQGGGEAPPVLAPHLSGVTVAHRASEDPRVRAEAIRASGSASAAHAADPQALVRIAVATVIEDPAVLAQLALDREPLVRARALDRLSDDQLLRRGMADPSSVVRQVAVHRISWLAVHGRWTGRERALEVAAASKDGYLRWKAAWGLSAVGRRGVDILTRLLGDEDSDVRREAARSLGRRKSTEAYDDLVIATGDKNSFVQRWALRALGQIGDPRGVGILQAALDSPTKLTAEAAWLALQALGQPSDRPKPRFEPPGPIGTAPEAAAMVSSGDATVRKDLSKHLAGHQEIGGQPVLPWLGRLAADPDSEVRKSAIEAMGWTPGMGPAILGHLEDPDPDCLVTALDALRRTGGATAVAVGPLLSHQDGEIRLRAAEALAAAADPTAWSALEAVIGDPDERIRAAAISVMPTRLARGEASILVLRAAARTGKVDWLKEHPDLLVRWALPGADEDGAAYARGLIAREDDLLHARFSWNAVQDKPAAYTSLRPPVVRAYGHPDRG